MQIIHRTFCFGVCLFLLSCSSSLPPSQTSHGYDESLRSNSDTLISLERTICFGECPAYRVTLLSTGKIIFEESSFSESRSRYEDKIDAKDFQETLSAFHKQGFFELKDKYEPGSPECKEDLTDFPSAFIYVRVGDKIKEVVHYLGCQGQMIPKSLYYFENMIDSVANTNQWIKN